MKKIELIKKEIKNKFQKYYKNKDTSETPLYYNILSSEMSSPLFFIESLTEKDYEPTKEQINTLSEIVEKFADNGIYSIETPQWIVLKSLLEQLKAL